MKIKLLSTCILIATSIICKAQTNFQVSTFAGSGVSGSTDATGAAAGFHTPDGVCTDAMGNIYVADSYNHKIRKITPGGVVTTFAGSGFLGSTDGLGTAASFNYPFGVCSDATGNIYVGDGLNNKIRKITSTGLVTTFAGSGSEGSTDATGIAASFMKRTYICSDAASNIYVADAENHKIRKITPAGVVSTFAGSGIIGNTDGTGIAASFYYPAGICSDAAGNIYVADAFNHKIRKITPAGVVTTFAGSGMPGSNDGTGIAASFVTPSGLCSDATGNIYVTDANENNIRKITPAGVVTTLAGSRAAGSTDAIGIAAKFRFPSGICSDAAGNIYVADQKNNKIRKIQAVTPTPPVINYLNLPASVCMGSNVDQSATATGSAAQLVSSSVSLNILSPKAICKNDSFVFILNSIDDGFGFFLDTIRQYDFSGTLINTIGLIEIGNEIIAADTNNMIYAVHPDPNNSFISNIRRIFPNGYTDYSLNIPSFVLDKVLALELGPDGFLYASENSTGIIRKIDVNTSIVSDLTSPAPAFSFNKVVDFAFDKAGDMYLADIGANKILKRNAADNNYYPAVPGLDTLLPNITSISIDNSGAGSFFLSSRVANTPLAIMQANTPFEIIDSIYYQTTLNINKPKATMFVGTGSLPTFWALDSINNQVKIVSAGFYQITPALPSGLSYNIINGSIFGNALAPAPLTTYTISVTNSFGTTTSTLSFEVAPPTTLSNAPGTSSTIGNQADGLTVKYFSPNNCNKMIEIADAQGGTSIGAVEVKETVSNLATFSSANFVGRVTEVNTQNPNASAVLRLFFTHQDIVNYNAANGAGADLTNDTLPTGLGTMQVAVLQLHTKENGHIEQIQHNPITANWNRTQQNWIVEFPITKFSTFYTGEPTELSTFTCENGSQSTIVSPNSFYIWNNSDSLLSSGQYMDTLVNRTGCDSILTLDLTLNAVGIDNTPVLEKGISLYPNPNSGLLHLDILNPNISITNVSITNLLGSEVYHADKVNSKSTIDLSTLQTGIYFVQISSEHEKITRKIILE